MAFTRPCPLGSFLLCDVTDIATFKRTFTVLPMKSIDKKSSKHIITCLFLILSAWIFICICWKLVNSPARQSISVTHATRKLLGKDSDDFVKYAKQAIRILDAFTHPAPADADHDTGTR